ncbi:MAG: adenylate/guanylate cyclase domain-containing protein [Actinomycetota bacterium]
MPDDFQALEKENRTLAKKLSRLETSIRDVEEMRDSTARLMTSLAKELDDERARSHSLLLNILPQPIIDRLGAGEQTIADRYDDVTVLFSDLVGFTSISSSLDATTLVTQLNAMFSQFDELCARYEVEKIKTIGDAYLAVGGLPGTREDHTVAVAELATGMRDVIVDMGDPWRIRIGLHRGPAVAGVIGTHKFVYDVWGDTVNTASRLETSAKPNAIHVSREVAERLGDRFEVRARGRIELKGKGQVETYVLSG